LDPLTFVAKIIGTTARVGGAVALAAGTVVLGHRVGFSLFVNLNDSLYQGVVVAGLIGACVVAVELVILAGKGVRWIGSRIFERLAIWGDHRIEKKMALKNMMVLTPDFAQSLRFLKSQGMKRFPADADNPLLFQMRQSFLLKTDDPNLTMYSIRTYYLVPDYVWDAVDIYLKDFPPPPVAPWMHLPDFDDRI